MNYRVLGTINKRVDVGIEGGTVFIHASSNCINFTLEEMTCLMRVLSIIENHFDDGDILHFLTRRHIEMWVPAPSPAEEKL